MCRHSHSFFDLCEAYRNICEDLQSSFRQSVLALKVSPGQLCAQGDEAAQTGTTAPLV